MTPLTLPGISTESLDQAQIHHVSADTALHLCGIDAPGLLIPYFDYRGERIEDRCEDFYRLRLDIPQGGQKYHQRAGTKPHAYLPPGIWNRQLLDNSFIYIIEGEKKALALSEAGFTAIGIGGFYNFRDRQGHLVDEIGDVLGGIDNTVIIFTGDRDVVFNFQFADAACKFATLLPGAVVVATCVPLDAPGKGLDDCREVLGSAFSKWWNALSLYSEQITATSTAAEISVQLLVGQGETLSKLADQDRDAAIRGISKLAANLQSHPLEQARVIEVGAQSLRVARAVLNRMVKEERKNIASNLLDELIGNEAPVVDLGQQPGVWTKEVLGLIGPHTYVFGGKLCDLDDGKFVHHTPAALVSIIDSPETCNFVRKGAGGQISKATLTEKETRVINGAVRKNFDVLRPVEVLAQVPVLVWTGTAPELITGYSHDHRILAGELPLELPTPEDAKDELLNLIRDFDFVTPGDAGRAIAFLLTTALCNGGFLGSGRVPFFMIEKDKIGAGGGTFVRMLAAIYGIKPRSITPDDPKAAREDVSKHLLEGTKFIYFDNIRKKILAQLPFFESLLTEPKFTCRAPYLHGEVSVRRNVFACTSNGAVLSPDLADRTVKIAIHKQPEGYDYHPWPEGGIVDHVVANQGRYLACVYALVQAWATQGRPRGSQLSGFRFSEWERGCAWVLENFFAPLPLLDATHKTAQSLMSNQDFDLLRGVFRAVVQQGIGFVSATELVRIAVEAGNMITEDKGAVLKMGRVLSKEFPKEGRFEFANEFEVIRRDKKTPDSNYDMVKSYIITPLPVSPEVPVVATPEPDQLAVA